MNYTKKIPTYKVHSVAIKRIYQTSQRLDQDQTLLDHPKSTPNHLEWHEKLMMRIEDASIV